MYYVVSTTVQRTIHTYLANTNPSLSSISITTYRGSSRPSYAMYNGAQIPLLACLLSCFWLRFFFLSIFLRTAFAPFSLLFKNFLPFFSSFYLRLCFLPHDHILDTSSFYLYRFEFEASLSVILSNYH
jgi:hypothetical protein